MYQITNQTVSAAVTEALRKQTRTFRNRISFGYWTQSGTFASQHTITSLRSLSVTQNGIAAEQLSMSGCPTSELRAEFNTTAAQRSYAFKGRLCFVECGVVYSGGQVAYIPIGYFNITEAATENDWQTVTVKGYDFAQSWTEKFSAAGATASALLGDFCNSKHINLLPGTGVSARLSARTVTPEELAILQSLSEREAVAALAGLVGCNARMNAENKLSVRFFDVLPASVQTEQTIPPALQWQGGFKKTSDTAFTIQSLTSNDNESDETDNGYSRGNGTGVLFPNSVIKHSDIDDMFDHQSNFPWIWRSYQPCEVEWRGDPRVECGDVMQASYKNADYTVLVARQEIDLTGGFSQRITCPAGDGEISFDTLDRETRKALNRQYTALEAALAAATQAINGAEGGYVEINDTNNDGNPDEIRIKATEGGTGNVIVMNKNGIGFSSNGGTTYITVIGFGGIAAENIVSGTISTDRLNLGAIGNGIQISGNQVTGLDSKIQTIIDNANLVSSSDLTAELAGYAKANKVTLLTDQGIYTGSITTEQINVGWNSENYAAMPADNWSDYTSKAKENWLTITTNGTPAYPKITVKNNQGSSDYAIVKSPYFYVAAGVKLKLSFTSFLATYSSSARYMEVTIEKKGSTSSGYVLNTKADAANTSVNHSAEWTISESAYYCVTVMAKYCQSSSYISNLSCTQGVKGEMIVNGVIKSVDSTTYFDLNNAEMVTENNLYKACFNAAELSYSWNDYFTGGICGYAESGMAANRRMVLYSPKVVEIGIGDNASGAIGSGLSVSSEGISAFGTINALQGVFFGETLLQVDRNSVLLCMQAVTRVFEIKNSYIPSLRFNSNGTTAEIYLYGGKLYIVDGQKTDSDGNPVARLLSPPQ